MSHTVGVEVVEGRSDLVGELFGALLSDCEATLLKVGEKVTAV